ncbi:bifunctional (p)ppGpp synthetase/guanosine-3',5'-bis(diphosphate) 3'-pyrophosphohydrolase [Desulfobulbus sp. TB]|nr:bifunctional (p)ppGpp synthetase/guanosine-3',5'-bis(diphosphate) 3'-pyrophosphohydrolase [Desulfobulbus sp. TB]
MPMCNIKLRINKNHLRYLDDSTLLEEVIYRPTEKFSDIHLPKDYRIKVYKLMGEYIVKCRDNDKKNSYNKHLNAYLAILLTGAKENEIKLLIRKDSIKSKILNVLSLYNYFYNDFIKSYTEYNLNVLNEVSFFDSNDNDAKYSKMFHQKILNFSKNFDIESEDFYLILFFDLFFKFNFFIKNRILSKRLIPLARFVLINFPSLVGTYKYGHYSSSLRDYAFKVANEKKFLSINKSISHGYPSDDFTSNIFAFLSELPKKLPCKVEVSGRKKGVYSSFVKSRQYNVPVQKLWDLYAVRVVIESNDSGHCYEVLSLIDQKWSRWDNKKGYCDYIASPKDNGYQSLHVVVTSSSGELIEVQIRTSYMHFNAEQGPASHQDYKNIHSEYARKKNIRDGKAIITRLLNEEKLTLGDFFEYLSPALKIIPIEHYYERIAKNKYNPNEIVKRIIERKNK